MCCQGCHFEAKHFIQSWKNVGCPHNNYSEQCEWIFYRFARDKINVVSERIGNRMTRIYCECELHLWKENNLNMYMYLGQQQSNITCILLLACRQLPSNKMVNKSWLMHLCNSMYGIEAMEIRWKAPDEWWDIIFIKMTINALVWVSLAYSLDPG